MVVGHGVEVHVTTVKGAYHASFIWVDNLVIIVGKLREVFVQEAMSQYNKYLFYSNISSGPKGNPVKQLHGLW